LDPLRLILVCTCTRVVLEYHFIVLVLVLVLVALVLATSLLGCDIRQTVNCRQTSFSGCRPSSPDLEFFTGARRRGSNSSVLQKTLENVLTATIVLTSTLVVLEATSVT